MAEEINRKDKMNGILLNEKKIPPALSSTLKLDSLLKCEEKIDLNESFELDNVTDLSLQNNNLFQLPLNFDRNLSNLITINLCNNNLEEIDSCFKTLKKLEQLIVENNRLKELPSFLGELNNLRLINVKGNKLIQVPESLENLINLEEIDFSQNKIKNVPDSLRKLDKLRIFKFANNDLGIVPNCLLTGFERLEILDLSHNFISEFDTPLFSKNLRTFYLNNNKSNHQFPAWLLSEQFSNLEELVLDETLFTSFDIPENLPVLKLKKLSMNQCGVSDTIFERITQSMIDLEYLNVGNETPLNNGNIFWVMPVQSFKNPGKLEEINIQGAGLPAVPEEINILQNLTRLNISRNNISSLPDEICSLQKLELINAARNNLYTLPQSIGNLTALKILVLETNRLSSLPDSLQRLTFLEYLDLFNNEFLQVPEQLKNITNLKALDIDGNAFKPENLELANIEYLQARNNLRSTSNALLLRGNDQKVLNETDDESSESSLEYEDNYPNEENKSLKDLSLSDIDSVENWDISEDSADEFDPTAQPKTFLTYSPFTVSSVFYYGNFCPADIHNKRVKDQVAAMERGRRGSSRIEEGQFDDA